MKAVPIIWLPQDISEIRREADRSTRQKPYFENSSIQDLSIASLDDLPLWRQNEIRKKRFRRRQHRYAEEPLFTGDPLDTKNDPTINKRRLFPHLAEMNTTTGKIDKDTKSNSALFLPKVRLSPHKQTSPSLLSDVLKTTSLQPKRSQENNINVQLRNNTGKNIYGRHYHLPSLKQDTDDAI